MPWNLDNNRPIYLQIMETIQKDIIAGVYMPGHKLPSVRELALEASVNPNTMQKAMVELERIGLVHTHRTSGRYITDDQKLLKNLQRKQATAYIDEFFDNMRQLGFSDAETNALILNHIGAENK